MKITAATLIRRRTHGPYEHEEVTVHAEISDSGSYEQQILQLRTIVERTLYTEKPAVETPTHVGVLDSGLREEKVQLNKEGEPAATATFLKGEGEPKSSYPPAKEEKPKSAPRTGRGKAADKAGSESAPADAGAKAGVDQQPDTANESGVQSSSAEASAPVEEPKKEAPKAAKGIVTFDNSQQPHRARLATFLGETYPTWKAKGKDKLAEISNGLNGKPFEDSKGNMLESFKEELKKHFA